MKLPVSVLIPTFNEECNIRFAIESVIPFSDDIHVLDSFSADKTLSIAEQYDVKIVQHKFEGYSKQWNWALDHIAFKYDYVFLMAADEAATDELVADLKKISVQLADNTAYFVNRRLIWFGKWIRRGYYPSWDIRLFDRRKCRFEDRAVNERLIVPDQRIAYIDGDLLHHDRKGLRAWLERHIKYAQLEAKIYMAQDQGTKPSFFNDFIKGTPASRIKWLRSRVYNHLPLFIRPFFYFIYRYILRLGFLDGVAGFIFHSLHGFWYPFLIDVQIFEYRQQQKEKS